MKELKAAVIAAAVATAVWAQPAAHAQSAAPVLEPATQRFIDALAAKNLPPIYTLSPADARNVLAGAQAQPVKKQAAKIEDRVIDAGPTGKIALRIVRPEHAKGALPVVMYFHGGGWVLGDKNTHDRLVREIANGAQAAVVFVDYDRSPETKYPVPIEEAYAATRYVADHAREFGVDASRMAVAGDSVGGNMTAAVTLLAKKRGGPALRAQVLFYPVTDASFDDGSYTRFANGPWLTRDAMKWFWDAYAPNEADREKITASPLRASIDELKGLPPALVITDENDVLRDEGEAYARKLTQAGVPVTSVRYNGTIHDFVMLNALADTPATRAAIGQANATLRAALQK
ncbi:MULTISPECIES: alpha/beta hydrolase [Caballeronia]|uniref:alpha/beta hydrolase n=1 Tax=Caballeronia TaxID=1827195 RepID=UPI0002D8C9CB|nr:MULTISPECIES: alpha/beta hydrolase [unclassified Caballeronia]MCE4542876.1 alpha/beta hydrolase fold domain-containing protein [Caballeronia sp. PC1]MCE4568068.1 alpha/beta hydrolase fold domain-containing protein [Caballeronia sp. CLC5]BAO85395.1 putative exported lipase/esterase [Burkholderia sp. RPE67]BBP95225.1 esterase [Burkholderia sp. SFA1]